MFRNISFRVPESGIALVLGGSGAGKTSLLKVIAQLYLPSQGSVALGGYTVTPGAQEAAVGPTGGAGDDSGDEDWEYDLYEADEDRSLPSRGCCPSSLLTVPPSFSSAPQLQPPLGVRRGLQVDSGGHPGLSHRARAHPVKPPARGRDDTSRDQHRVGPYDARRLRQGIGFLMQETRIIPGTLVHNVFLDSRPLDTDERLYQAARDLEAFIGRHGFPLDPHAFPQGLLTLVESDRDLVPEHRQKIGLLRIVLHRW